MEQFFVKDFTNGPFVLFSPSHIAALLAILLVNLSFIFVRRSNSTWLRQGIRYTLAALLIINESLWHIWNLVTGQWTIQTMLPLHLCSVFVFLCAIMLVSRSYRIYEFAYLLGIAGAIQAILTPDLGIYDFPHFRYFQVFVSHGAIVTAALYMSIVEGYRPTRKSLGRVFIGSNIYMLFVGMVNAVIGSNYLYIAHKPETASLMDMLGPWPWYILALEGLGLISLLILYLPFGLRDVFCRTTHPISDGSIADNPL